MKKRYVIALVIVIAGLITLWKFNAPVPTYQTLIVRPGDLQQSVLATGKLGRAA